MDQQPVKIIRRCQLKISLDAELFQKLTMKQLFAIVAVAVVLSSSVVVVTDAKPQHRHPISPVLNGTSTEDNDDIDCIEVRISVTPVMS